MKIWKNSVLFYLGGMGYMGLELLWRGWSHGSMFLVGGICFLLLGHIGTLFPGMPLFFQSVLGGCVVTGMELVSGLVINRGLGLGVWDYSAMAYSFMGQVCLGYSFLWILVSFLAILLDGLLRRGLFGEEMASWRVV